MTGHCSCLLLLKRSSCLRQPVPTFAIVKSIPPKCSLGMGKALGGMHTCYTCAYICVCGEASLACSPRHTGEDLPPRPHS